jgi:hypothetical protein
VSLIIIAALLQWHYGMVPGHSRRDLVIQFGPYVGIIFLFVVANFVRTTFVTEKEAHYRKVRSRRRGEHYAERASESEKRKPIVHEPNLKFRRFVQDRIWVGHEISGHSTEAVFIEIGNELAERIVGQANDIKAHITYSDSNKNKLHIRCPGFWTTEQDEIRIPPGEGRLLQITVRKGVDWVTDLYQGIQLESLINVEVRLLNKSGQLTADSIFLELLFRTNSSPICKWVQAAS